MCVLVCVGGLACVFTCVRMYAQTLSCVAFSELRSTVYHPYKLGEIHTPCYFEGLPLLPILLLQGLSCL